MASLPILPTPGPMGGQPAGGFGAAPQGTLPYQPPQASNLVQGINEFLKQYKSTRQQEQQHHMELAQRDIQNLMLGLPVDIKKTAATMKKAGLNLDFESDIPKPGGTAPQVGYSLPGVAPGGAGTNVQVPSMPGTPPPPSAAAPPPSGLQGLLSALGMTPPQINPNSPGMAALKNMGSMGQMQQRGQVQQMQNQQQMQSVVTSALQGNPQATELATRFGLAHSLPGDEWFRMGHAAGMDDTQVAKQHMWIAQGGPALRKELVDMADKNKSAFDGNMDQSLQYYTDILNTGHSSLKPGISFDEQLKIMDHALKLQELHPTMPDNIAMTTALMTAQGDSAKANALREYVAKTYPTKGQIDWTKWSSGMQLDLKRLATQQSQFAASHELSVINSARDALGAQFNEFERMYNNKDADQGTKNSALQGMVDALQKKGSLKVKIGGQEISLGAKDLTMDRVANWMNPFDLHPLGGKAQMGVGFGAPNIGQASQAPGVSPLSNPLAGFGMNNMMQGLSSLMEIPSYITGDEERKAYRTKQMETLKEIIGRTGY